MRRFPIAPRHGDLRSGRLSIASPKHDLRMRGSARETSIPDLYLRRSRIETSDAEPRMHKTAFDNTKPDLRRCRSGLGPRLARFPWALPPAYAALGVGAGGAGVAELGFRTTSPMGVLLSDKSGRANYQPPAHPK